MFDVIREALRAADEGTVEYMVEEQQRKLAEQQKTIVEQSEQLAKQDEQLAKQDEQLAKQSEQLAKHVQQMSDMEKENQKLREALAKANVIVD